MLNDSLYEIHLLILNETHDIEIQYSPAMKAFVAIIMSVSISLTILGNTLVMVAFIVDKRLRTRSNFFLLNLAICDFFIGKCLMSHCNIVLLFLQHSTKSSATF